MKISDTLKSRGLFSNDIKSRFKNKQMTLDGEVLEQDIDIDVQDELIDAGEFICEHIASDSNKLTLCHIIGFENLFACNIESDFINFLKTFHVLRISKREVIVLKKMSLKNTNEE